MRGRRRLWGTLALIAASTLLLSGCAATTGTPTGGGRVAVVASTDVWGSVVTAVGAGHVDVTSIIDDPSRDPHDYEADVRDRLHVLRAAVVVENGGGYDDFMTRLRDGAAGRVIDAVRLSGFDAAAPGFNEHVWYDLPTVRRVAAAVDAALQQADPRHAASYRAALTRFEAQVDALATTEAAIRRRAAGRGAAITEPVPLHLLTACGLVDRTPAAFSTAVEDGRDVAPGVLQVQLRLLREHRVVLLAVNEQAVEPTTEQVVAAARTAGVPVVGFRETLPSGGTLLGLFHTELAAVARAVAA